MLILLQLSLLLLGGYAAWRFRARQPWLYWLALSCAGAVLFATLESGTTALTVRLTGIGGLLLVAGHLSVLLQLRQEERLQRRLLSQLRESVSAAVNEAEEVNRSAPNTPAARTAGHQMRAVCHSYTSTRLDGSLRGSLVEIGLLTLTTAALLLVLAIARSFNLPL